MFLPWPQVTPWAGPRPPSGTHRYVFLAYAQPGEEPLDVGWLVHHVGHTGGGAQAPAGACGRCVRNLGCGVAPLIRPVPACPCLPQIADPQVAGGGRSNFSVRAFQSEHQLGQPCGVAWFLSSPM